MRRLSVSCAVDADWRVAVDDSAFGVIGYCIR